MKIRVCSEAKAKEVVSQTIEPTLVISITCPTDVDVDFTTTSFIKDIVRVKFDDVSRSSDTMKAIQPEDAKLIATKVLQWKDEISQIIVHCYAGMSRSAGVAAAIGKYLIDDDTFIFDEDYYYPNMTCYQKVLSALMESEV